MELLLAVGGIVGGTLALATAFSKRHSVVTIPGDDDTEIIVIKGDINGQMAKRFGDQVARCTRPRIALIIDSNGGRISPVHDMIHRMRGYTGQVRVMIPHRAYSSGTLLAFGLHKSPEPMWMGKTALITPFNAMADTIKYPGISSVDLKRTEQRVQWKWPGWPGWRALLSNDVPPIWSAPSLMDAHLAAVRLEHFDQRTKDALERFCRPNLNLLSFSGLPSLTERDESYGKLQYHLLTNPNVHHYTDFFTSKDLTEWGILVDGGHDVPPWMQEALDRVTE